MRLLIALTAVGLLSACRSSVMKASPCAGVDRSLTNERKAELAPIIAKQLRVSRVDILQSFAENGWYIIYVDTHESDDGFLFFPSDPASTHYVTLWGGAALYSETPEINDWTLKNASGIPRHLAGCFAWHVTPDRDL